MTMSKPHAAAPDGKLLRDLMDGLSIIGRDARLSVGFVGNAAHAAQPPGHCLQACLGGDPCAAATRGCPLLAAAARNEADAEYPWTETCARGFQVVAQRVALGDGSTVLLAVEGALEPLVDGEGADLLGHLDAAARLLQGVGQTLEENAGFADEVLQNYEQLNLIFDLTQQITQVTDAREIEKLLLRRIATMFCAAAVWVVVEDGQWRLVCGDTLSSATPPGPPTDAVEIGQAIKQVRSGRQVRVTSAGQRPVIIGPLVRLDDRVDVVLVVSGAGRGAFTSGDTLLFDSVLAFGGQIISNTELHERLRTMSLEVTRAMVSAIDKKDHYTSGHSERVGFLSRMVARQMGRSPAEQQNMEWAGLLHDVGKIGTPEEILCKPGKLTKEEFEVIKQHPVMSYEILKPIASLGGILEGVLYHHEYPDGSGYPEGLAGDRIPLVARIIHVADTFDALTSTRSYRRAFTIENALKIIAEESGQRVDAEVTDAFFNALEAYRRDDPEDFAARFLAQRECHDDVV